MGIFSIDNPPGRLFRQKNKYPPVPWGNNGYLCPFYTRMPGLSRDFGAVYPSLSLLAPEAALC
jgi:hypothetical protein